MANIIGTLSFVSSKQKIAIKLKGINSVSINFGTETENYDLSKNEIVIEYDFGNVDSHYIVVNNAQNITEIDISNNGINNVSLYLCTLLKKFVAYNNNIHSLNFTNSNALQYVHIQNNPICNNESIMANMINSLPDRNGKAYGSVIMYDFVPPREMNDITEAQQSIRELRKKLENISIPKDWYFGSAIIYDEEEYAKCMNIKDSHVTDVWESAEYGEGLIVSSKESGYASPHPEIESSRIIEHKTFDKLNHPTSIIDKTNFSITEGDYQTHGTKTSTIIGADNNIYGPLPCCKFKLLDSNFSSVDDNVYCSLLKNFFDDTIDILYLSQSGLTKIYAEGVINAMTNDNKRLVFTAAANDGDNVLNTNDHETSKYPWLHLVENSSLFFVAGLDNNNHPAGASTWCQDVIISDDISKYSPFFSNSTKDFSYRYHNGTSFSAPLVAGYAGILQILFTKKYGKKPTKNELTNEIFKRCNPLKEHHRYKVGNGRIDFSIHNTMENADALTESIQVDDSITMDLYSKHKLEYKILPENVYNNNITIESTDDNIVQISNDNTLFASSIGSCEIIVFSNDGAFKKSIPVIVNGITEAIFEKENPSLVGKFEKENFTPNGEWTNSISDSNIKLYTNDVNNNFNITSVNGYLEIPHIQTNLTISFRIKNLISTKYNGRIWSLYNTNETEPYTLDFMFTTKENQTFYTGYLERDVNNKSDYTKTYYSALQDVHFSIGQDDIVTTVFNRETNQIITYFNGRVIYENILVDRTPKDLKLCIGNSRLHNKAVVGANFSNINVFNRALTDDEILDNVARQLKINNNIIETEGDEGQVEYKGSVTLISGLKQANNGNFALAHATAIQYKNEENEDGTFKSVEQKIDEIAGDNSKFATSEDVDNIISDLFG